MRETDSRAPELYPSASRKRILPDTCRRTERVVRTKKPGASAIRAYGFPFDTPTERGFPFQIEKKAGKSTAETRLAVAVFPRCGQKSGAMRTNGPRIAHKKSVFSAWPSATLRKESGVFAGKELKSANKRNEMYRNPFHLERIRKSVRQRKQEIYCFLSQKTKICLPFVSLHTARGISGCGKRKGLTGKAERTV